MTNLKYVVIFCILMCGAGRAMEADDKQAIEGMGRAAKEDADFCKAVEDFVNAKITHEKFCEKMEVLGRYKPKSSSGEDYIWAQCFVIAMSSEEMKRNRAASSLSTQASGVQWPQSEPSAKGQTFVVQGRHTGGYQERLPPISFTPPSPNCIHSPGCGLRWFWCISMHAY